jgi:3-oxoacid CoA-transferase B subunit
MPTLCSDFIPAGKGIVLHSENGVIGYGRLAGEGEENPFAVNAGGQHVVLEPYASIVRHDDSFAVVRKGLLDVAVLGAYEVGANGDLANWKLAGRKGAVIGSAHFESSLAPPLRVVCSIITNTRWAQAAMSIAPPIPPPLRPASSS